MKAYRIHVKGGGYQFDDMEPRESCTYDIVDLKLPIGAVISSAGGAKDTLMRVKLAGNTKAHLETNGDDPVLMIEMQKGLMILSTNEFIKLKYDVIESNLTCDFSPVCSKETADNIYRIIYMNGRYYLTSLYDMKAISRQEAMKYQTAWE